MKVAHGLITGKIPQIDLEIHKRTVALVLALISGKHALSAQDISDGGLAVALAECCFGHRIGAEIMLDDAIRTDSLLFGETQSRVIITALPKSRGRIEELARRHHVPIKKIGVTGGANLKITLGSQQVVKTRLLRAVTPNVIDTPIEKLRRVYEEAIPKLMEHVTVS